MPAADLGDVRIHYRFDGPEDGPVLVLSNSLGTNLHMWNKVLPALAARFRVLRYDTRGHGQSSVTEPPYSVAQLAGDLTELLDHLELTQVKLCGLSLGGLTAMWLAIHEPERFERLIFANTAAKIGNAAMWNERIAAIRAEGMTPLAAATMRRWFTEAFVRESVQELALPRAVMAEMAADGYIGCCMALRDEDLRGEIGSIAAPCLVIASTYDVATPVGDGRALHAGLAHSEFVELEAAHLSAWELPEPFAAAVLRFLDGA